MREIKVLFIGASGYGNLGDDMYKIVFQKQLSEMFKDRSDSVYVRCIFDSPYPDTRMIKSCDLIVVGGGGLIYNNGTEHFIYMSMYLEEALKHRKPIAFSSCGVQYADYKHGITKPEIMAENLKPWKKYFDRAEFISVRSEFCKKVVQLATSNKNVYYGPDIGYLIKPYDYSISMKNSILILPTNTGVGNPKYKKFYNELVKPGSPVYFAAMSRDDYQITEALAKSVDSHENYGGRKFLSPPEVCAMIRDAKTVITWRYHGLIFGRAMGKIVGKDLFVADGRYKSLVEDMESDIVDGPKIHIKLISDFITSIL